MNIGRQCLFYFLEFVLDAFDDVHRIGSALLLDYDLRRTSAVGDCFLLFLLLAVPDGSHVLQIDSVAVLVADNDIEQL